MKRSTFPFVRGALEKGARGLAPLVRVDLCVAETRGIVSGNVESLKALFLRNERPLPSDAVTDTIEPSQALDIEVNELSRVVSFVAHGRRGRLEVAQPAQSSTPADASDPRRTHLDEDCDLSDRPTLFRRPMIRSCTADSIEPSDRGLELRSVNGSVLDARPIHSRPRRSLIPAASDAARTDHPCSETRL